MRSAITVAGFLRIIKLIRETIVLISKYRHYWLHEDEGQIVCIVAQRRSRRRVSQWKLVWHATGTCMHFDEVMSFFKLYIYRVSQNSGDRQIYNCSEKNKKKRCLIVFDTLFNMGKISPPCYKLLDVVTTNLLLQTWKPTNVVRNPEKLSSLYSFDNMTICCKHRIFPHF